MKIEQEKDLSEVKVKRVIICCNGFINTKKHNLKCFKDYFETINTDENNEVCLISLYSPEDKTTYNRNKQYNVLKSKINEYVQKNYIIYLLGYSYTAGFVAKAASEYPEHIRKLILISPTIYLLKTKLLWNYLKVAAKYIHMKIKNPVRTKKAMSKSRMQGIIPISYNIALSIYKNRRYFKKVKCKVFVGKVQNDELCIGKTLWKITHKLLASMVTIKSYVEGGHTMIMDLEYGKQCYDDILAYTFHIANPDDKKDEEAEKLATLSFTCDSLRKSD